MKDILIIECVQCCATKYHAYIPNDYTSHYKTQLIKLLLFPLMYQFELHILFTIKIMTPTIQFNITN